MSSEASSNSKIAVITAADTSRWDCNVSNRRGDEGPAVNAIGHGAAFVTVEAGVSTT